MAKIIPINSITKMDLPVERVLEAAKDELEGALIIGFDKDGDLFCSSTYADGGTVLWLLESAKKALFDCVEDIDG